ncbi:DUF1592 domain-containing protein [Novipirellula artificiosorum]|nr:DUF1592 domain-containing protein [Novipirellula artificiosorum]
MHFLHPPRTLLRLTLSTLCVFAWSGPLLADQATTESVYSDSLLPLLRTYCFDCHDSGSDLSLEDDDSATKIAGNRKLWQRAFAQVQLGTMPPEDGETMAAAVRMRMVDMLDQVTNSVDCIQAPNAGKVVLRRLNRTEYRNTIRDLTGVDYQPADNFPGDDVGYGFDNIGDVLSLPPILLEKYLDAAEVISGQAILTPLPPQIFETELAAVSLVDARKYGRGDHLTLSSQGTVALEVEIPFQATYDLTVSASGDQGGDEPVKMEVVVGKSKQIVDVKNKQMEPITIPVRLDRGKRRIEFSFINDYYLAGKADRNLHLYHVHLVGTEPAAKRVKESNLPASHRKIIFVTPSDTCSEDQATQQVLEPLTRRAFRRPVNPQEIGRLARLAASVRADGATFEESIQVALQAILVSPHFLFKVESPPEKSGSGQSPVNPYELATRISYFLWSSMPDDELLQMASKDQLRDREPLLRKVGDMILDPRSNALIENFAGQWLQLRTLQNVEPDGDQFPLFDDHIRQLMQTETLTFFASVMRDNRPVTDLLDANFTYVNEDLAKFYGFDKVLGADFRKVSLEGTPRGGLLTQASILTVTSNPTRTSPVKRGKWILENLLNTPPPPPPPNVPELEKGILSGTLRERLEEHRANPACAACHNMMDPLGFALEHFDAIGRYRNLDGEQPIDASGKLPDGTEFSGIEDLRRILSQQRGDQFVRCLAEKMLIYAIGRGTEYYDKCALDEIMGDLRQNDYRFADLVSSIIESEPFQSQGSRE